jgi:hypothetical protein
MESKIRGKINIHKIPLIKPLLMDMIIFTILFIFLKKQGRELKNLPVFILFPTLNNTFHLHSIRKKRK